MDCPLPAGSRRSQAWGKNELPLADEDVGVPWGRTVSAGIAELYSAWMPESRVQLGDPGGGMDCPGPAASRLLIFQAWDRRLLAGLDAGEPSTTRRSRGEFTWERQ
jgi:hypothetical protein